MRIQWLIGDSKDKREQGSYQHAPKRLPDDIVLRECFMQPVVQ
jgi:hypothetical protein